MDTTHNMVEIDFTKFKTDDEFHDWLTTDPGHAVFSKVYDTVMEVYNSDSRVRHIPVIVTKYDNNVYSIDMKNINGFCERAIKYFEYKEEFLKCHELHKILLSNKNKL